MSCKAFRWKISLVQREQQEKILFWKLGPQEEQQKKTIPRHLVFCKQFKAFFINDSGPSGPWLWPWSKTGSARIHVPGRKENLIYKHTERIRISENWSTEKNTWEKNTAMADTKMCKDYIFQQAIARRPRSEPTWESPSLLAFPIL